MAGAFDDPKFMERIAKLVAMLGAPDAEAANAWNLLQRHLTARGLKPVDLAEYLKRTGVAGAARSAQLERDLRRAESAWNELQRQFDGLLSRGRSLEEQLHSARGEREDALRSRDEVTRELAAVRAEIELLRKQMEEPPEAVRRISVLSIAANVSKAGDRYRFHLRVEGENESNHTLGWTGITINVPTIDSPEGHQATEIQMSSIGCNPPFRKGPGDIIFGFRDDRSFGEKTATGLLIEAVREQWPPRGRIALEAVLLASYSRLDMQVRVWSNRPDNEDGGAFGDPDWASTKPKDQQGIPAYNVSIGFD